MNALLPLMEEAALAPSGSARKKAFDGAGEDEVGFEVALAGAMGQLASATPAAPTAGPVKGDASSVAVDPLSGPGVGASVARWLESTPQSPEVASNPIPPGKTNAPIEAGATSAPTEAGDLFSAPTASSPAAPDRAQGAPAGPVVATPSAPPSAAGGQTLPTGQPEATPMVPSVEPMPPVTFLAAPSVASSQAASTPKVAKAETAGSTEPMVVIVDKLVNGPAQSSAPSQLAKAREAFALSQPGWVQVKASGPTMGERKPESSVAKPALPGRPETTIGERVAPLETQAPAAPFGASPASAASALTYGIEPGPQSAQEARAANAAKTTQASGPAEVAEVAPKGDARPDAPQASRQAAKAEHNPVGALVRASESAPAVVSGPAAPENPTHSPLRGEELVRQIAQQTRHMSLEGKREVHMRLQPPALGNLRVQVTVQDGAVTVRMTAENAVVKGMLEANLPQLQSALTDQGLRPDRLVVVVSQSAGFFDPSQRRSRNWEAPEARRAAGPAQERAEPVLPILGSSGQQTGLIDYRV